MTPLLRNLLILLIPSLMFLWAAQRADRRGREESKDPDASPSSRTLPAFAAGVLTIPLALVLGWGLSSLLVAMGLLPSPDGPGGLDHILWMFDRSGAESAQVGDGRIAGPALLRAVLVAGLVEESLKLGAALLVTRGTTSPVLRHGAALGLGFAIAEAGVHLTGSFGAVLARLILVAPLHAGLTGILLVVVGGSARRRREEGARPPILLSLLSVLVAAIAHGAFNLIADIVLVGAAMIVALVLIVAVVVNGIRVGPQQE